MKPEILKLWIERLRDPKSKQTCEVLRDRNGCFCSLGLLVDIYRTQTGHGAWLPVGDEGTEFGINGIPVAEYVLPYAVRKWADVENSDPWVVTETGDYFTVSQLNDHQSLSFGEVADILEKSKEIK